MKKFSSLTKILAGFILGTSIGLLLCECADAQTVKKILPFIAPFGNALVAMLKMVVYPIILFSLIVGAASMPIKKSGKVGGLVMTWYMGTSLFATLFGVLMAYLLNPRMASATQVAASHAESAKALTTAGTAANASFGTFLTSLFQNPFSALANGQFLPIIVFAIAFGLAARWILDKATTDAATHKAVSTLITVCDGAQKIMFSLIECVVAYFPIGVFALSLVNFAENGTLLFGPYARITLCVVVGVAGMILLVYPLALALCCRQNPYRVLLRLRQAMLTAFVTRSSAATLPVSFKVMDELGVSRSLSSFSLPMGATINMDGVCVHLPVFVILAANMFGHHFGILDIATLCLMIMFASIGTGGIPGGSVFLLYMVLESMGLPADQIALVVALALGINPILDMFETCCNVTGDNVCTYIVHRLDGEKTA